jgi:hypothetical protein
LKRVGNGLEPPTSLYFNFLSPCFTRLYHFSVHGGKRQNNLNDFLRTKLTLGSGKNRIAGIHFIILMKAKYPQLPIIDIQTRVIRCPSHSN